MVGARSLSPAGSLQSPGVHATAAAAQRTAGPSPRSYAPAARALLHRSDSPAVQEVLPPHSLGLAEAYAEGLCSLVANSTDETKDCVGQLAESRHAVFAALRQLRQLETTCGTKHYSQYIFVAAGSN